MERNERHTRAHFGSENMMAWFRVRSERSLFSLKWRCAQLGGRTWPGEACDRARPTAGVSAGPWGARAPHTGLRVTRGRNSLSSPAGTWTGAPGLGSSLVLTSAQSRLLPISHPPRMVGFKNRFFSLPFSPLESTWMSSSQV